jgi:tRNA-2-methylthio-N6-dimethylallyladenosine synthase
VHFSVPAGAEAPRPGDLVTVTITEAAAFHLVSDPASAEDYSLRRSRAGDAWDRSQADSCGAGPAGKISPAGKTSASGTSGVSLGMPSLPVRGR